MQSPTCINITCAIDWVNRPPVAHALINTGSNSPFQCKHRWKSVGRVEVTAYVNDLYIFTYISSTCCHKLSFNLTQQREFFRNEKNEKIFFKNEIFFQICSFLNQNAFASTTYYLDTVQCFLSKSHNYSF